MLDKAIASGKEHRKPYRGSKAFDTDCRNHGSCDWCRSNRTYQKRKEQERIEWELRDYLEDGAYYCSFDTDLCYWYASTYYCGLCCDHMWRVH